MQYIEARSGRLLAYLIRSASRQATERILGSASNGIDGRLEGRGVIVGRHDGLR